MSALDDARRFFWLGSASTDDPIEILRALVADLNKLSRPAETSRVKFESKIAELESQVKQANDRTRTVEHKNVQLEEQMKSDRMMQRIRSLEADLKKANERTRLVEHQLVHVSEAGSRDKAR